MTRLRMECVCDLCRVVYQPWYADNSLWNAVMDPTGDREGFLCPTCFVGLAAAHSVTKVSRVTWAGSWIPCCDHCGCASDQRKGHDDACRHGCNDTDAEPCDSGSSLQPAAGSLAALPAAASDVVQMQERT